jgi:hypothetical protein
VREPPDAGDSSPPVAYPLRDGRPYLIESLVVFLDALGTKDVARDPHRAQARLEALYEAITANPMSLVLEHGRAFEAAFFTDNVVIGVPTEPIGDGGYSPVGMTLALVGAYQSALALHGVFTRGSIVKGPLWMNKSFVFGGGLVDAYEEERERAFYPRVIANDEVVELAKRDGFVLRRPAALDGSQFGPLLLAPDGLAFVNYLNSTGLTRGDEALRDLRIHRSAVLSGLFDNRARAGVVEKFQWAAAYHNWYCHRCFPDEGALRIEPLSEDYQFMGPPGEDETGDDEAIFI